MPTNYNESIFVLVGVLEENKSVAPMTIQPVHVAPSRVVMDLGEFDRFTKRPPRIRPGDKKAAPSQRLWPCLNRLRLSFRVFSDVTDAFFHIYLQEDNQGVHIYISKVRQCRP